MKKRLLKKKRLGKFAEVGRQLVVTRNTKANPDAFQDAFIMEAIEPSGCFCSGALSDEKIDVIVELGRKSAKPEEKFSQITDARPDVQAWRVGPMFDVWHETYEDIGEKLEQDVALISLDSIQHAAPGERAT